MLVKLCIGADHAGVELKQAIRQRVAGRGVEVTDVGADSTDPVDYPDIAAEVARTVSKGKCDRGILICGSGIGMAMVANKFRGVRAAVAGDIVSAEMSRRHNDANVLCLAARMIDADTAGAITDKWLDTPFEGGRHARRVQKIAEIEESECQT